MLAARQDDDPHLGFCYRHTILVVKIFCWSQYSFETLEVNPLFNPQG